MKIKHNLVSLLAVAALIGGNAAMSCDCSKVSVPPKPDDISAANGLQFSHTAQYRREMQKAVSNGKKFCSKYRKEHPTERNLCIVSDIDETVLDNRPQVQSTGVKDWDEFEGVVRSSEAPPIKPTVDFLKWARHKGYALFFVTGRPEANRTPTVLNLLKHQIPYDGLYCRENGNHEPAVSYKSRIRESIETMGFTIVCNIGDQYSDLAGGHSLDCEKLPNKMAYLP